MVYIEKILSWFDLDGNISMKSVYMKKLTIFQKQLKLILRLLEIRKLTHENSAIRFQEQYFDYDGEGVFMEHPLEFFPKNPLKKYPKNYSVSGNVDEDFCSKSYPTHSDFASGIFSVGCSCQKPITMGFTLMLKGESPRNIFRILMTRQWDRSTLRGIIYDHACGAHRYFLNREPRDFKNFNFIVDGCHFQGQRKMKKSTSGKASHLGCSESYSFMAYKPYTQLQIDGAHNSQGREQMHSVLEKLAPSLRQMNYSNFMRTLIIFFSVHNLWTMDKL